jgi:acid-sensing ion channel, other
VSWPLDQMIDLDICSIFRLEHFITKLDDLSDDKVEQGELRCIRCVSTVRAFPRLMVNVIHVHSRTSLTDDEKAEFFIFLESLANSSYVNFENIKDTPRTEEILTKLKIKPENYMRLIYNLTEDLTRKTGNIELKIRNVNNLEFIRATQVLTEYGICYTSNSLLAINMSTALLMDQQILPDDPFYKKYTLHDIRFGNLFDGDMTYSFIGFVSPITVFLHSPYEAMNIARSIGYTNEAYEFEAYSVEIITTKDFREDTFIQQRGCRFHSESNLTHYKVYSKNLCLSECRLNLVLKHCGCMPHFYPVNGECSDSYRVNMSLMFPLISSRQPETHLLVPKA